MKKNIEIVSLIYKSVDYLEFIAQQLKSELCQAQGWNVGVRIIANDATQQVKEKLPTLGIPYTIFDNPNPNEFYLNRVYRAYNYSVKTSAYNNICLLNSDNVISDNWLSNLLKYHDGTNIPCSRTIESGKMQSGKHCINLGHNDFGRTPQGFDFKGWQQYAGTVSKPEIKTGGIFCSPVFETKRFLESGGYPEGNVFLDNGAFIVGCPNNKPLYATSDHFLFYDILEKQHHMKHVTVFDSIIYHIMEGEKDS